MHVRLHIAPAIGHVRLDDLAPEQVQRLLTGIGRSPAYLRRIHDLRHGSGTILAAQGVPLSDIQAILGHRTITVTMRCVHALDETQVRAAKRMDDALLSG